MNDRDLMSLRADVNFTYDAHGRMLLTNEPLPEARRPAPRLFLGYTAAGTVIRLGATAPAGLARHLLEIVERDPPDDDPRPSPAVLATARAALGQNAAGGEEGGGPVYRFPSTFTASGEAIRLTRANRELVREPYSWLYDEIDDWQPCFVVVRDGEAVSVCFSSRLDRAAAEAGVDTRAAFRGRGYARLVVAAWGAAVRDSGRIPFYSTAWENLGSQGVARRLGLIRFGADAIWS